MTAVKELAHQVIESLPEEASMEDILYALYARTKFEEGVQEIREGKGLSMRR